MSVHAPGAPVQRRWFPAPLRVTFISSRLRKVGKLESVALGTLIALTILLLLVPLFAPHGATDDVGKSLTGPSVHHWMGIDEQGRDVLSRVLFGMRTSWFAAFEVIASGVVIGGLIGLVAGMSGGWIDNLLMRITDVFLALPGPLLVLAVVSALGPSLPHTLVAVGVVWWPFYARIVRGEVRSIASRSHVEAARMGGAGRLRVAFRHVVPGTFGAVLVTASLDIGALLLTLAGLSFLGLGSPAPAPELGAMTSRGLAYLFDAWWVPVFPALGVFLLAFIGNVAGDGVRDLVEA
ncbi:MAG: transporter permease [Actinomycetia bacterium]|jgi:ABC-type dipeptide/oligopeptide/nickel transport system permease subunit|nr:transporter permease [Actinomycetes bacterium]